MLDPLRSIRSVISVLPPSGAESAPGENRDLFAAAPAKGYQRTAADRLGASRLLLRTVMNGLSAVSFDFPDARGAPLSVRQNVDIARSALAYAYDDKTAQDIKVIKKILPSIVRVAAEDANNNGWYGSGSIMKPSDIIPGYEGAYGEYFVLTNQHVAGGSKYLTVKLANGEEYKAEVVRSKHGAELLDDDMDIALLRVHIPYSLPTSKLGDPKKLEIGQPIYTVGHPKALPHVAVTKGIISNPAQETGELSLDIQTDAPINGGNSGGPSFNQSGEFIGLNTYTFRDSENLTFTKPIDEQIDVLLNIWENGHVVRGAIDIELAALPLIDRIQLGFPEKETGAVVKSVKLFSAAATAGLRAGDIITWMEVRVNGSAAEVLDVNVHDWFEAKGIVKRWASRLLPGTVVSMIVYRKVNNIYMPMEINVPVELAK